MEWTIISLPYHSFGPPCRKSYDYIEFTLADMIVSVAFPSFHGSFLYISEILVVIKSTVSIVVWFLHSTTWCFRRGSPHSFSATFYGVILDNAATLYKGYRPSGIILACFRSQGEGRKERIKTRPSQLSIYIISEFSYFVKISFALVRT